MPLPLRVLLIAKGHRPQLEQPLTTRPQGRNVGLVAGGGGLDADPAIRVNEDRTAAHWHASDASDEGTGLELPQAYSVGFVAGGALVAQVDVVVSALQLRTGKAADGDVAVASDILLKRAAAAGDVEVARGIARKRFGAAGGVAAARDITQ